MFKKLEPEVAEAELARLGPRPTID
jgi:hypothetical protein